MSLLLALQGGGTPAPAPFKPSEQSNPVRRRQAGEFTVAANLLLTTLVVAAVPFAQGDWPNPQRARAGQADQVASRLALDVGSRPFAQLDWRIPGTRRAQQPEQLGSMLGTVLAPQGTPFVQAEWPNPRGKRQQRTTYHRALETIEEAPAQVESQARAALYTPIQWKRGVPQDQQQNLLGTTLTAEAQPFRPVDWIVPRGIKAPLFEASQNLLGTTLGAPAAPPFVQSEWLVAAMARFERFPNSLLTFVGGMPPEDAPAPAPSEWITRARRRMRR